MELQQTQHLLNYPWGFPSLTLIPNFSSSLQYFGSLPITHIGRNTYHKETFLSFVLWKKSKFYCKIQAFIGRCPDFSEGNILHCNAILWELSSSPRMLIFVTLPRKTFGPFSEYNSSIYCYLILICILVNCLYFKACFFSVKASRKKVTNFQL